MVLDFARGWASTDHVEKYLRERPHDNIHRGLFHPCRALATNPEKDSSECEEKMDGLGIWDNFLKDAPDEGEDDADLGARDVIQICHSRLKPGPEPKPDPGSWVGLGIFRSPDPLKPDPSPGFEARPDPHNTSQRSYLPESPALYRLVLVVVLGVVGGFPRDTATKTNFLIRLPQSHS
ncbi:hypothetical protein K438DRAFT_1960067 [Mycena galopus ATCC 62051]|nr:hypothetical protein K438DRAFT_1960067 [Mycena galopus ATCC 62051]